MKLSHITLFASLLFGASSLQAQNEEINIDSLKAQIKREVKQELADEAKAKVEAEDDLAAVGFEYVTVENATPTQNEETAPVEPEETTEGATALEETEEASDEDKTE